MLLPALESFVSQATAHAGDRADPADCVLAIAPLMLELIERAPSFLEPQHYRCDPDHYARNLVYDAPDASLSLYTLVWLPGQWTPVHDHGSWGVVGVLEGVLEERSYVRMHLTAGRMKTFISCAAASFSWAGAQSPALSQTPTTSTSRACPRSDPVSSACISTAAR